MCVGVCVCVPGCRGLLLPWVELTRLDLLLLLLVGRLLRPHSVTTGGTIAAGGTLPSLANKLSISPFCLEWSSWISFMCLEEEEEVEEGEVEEEEVEVEEEEDERLYGFM